MHFQVLSSGSAGNSTLLRAGDLMLLIDAGLPISAMRERMEQARVPFRGIDHILVTHGHLDHSRSAGIIAKKHDAVVHCPEKMIRHRSVARARRFDVIPIGSERILFSGPDALSYRPVLLPHDCDPTVAYRVDHGGRVIAVLTDMGVPRQPIATAMRGAHVLVLEFNYDEALLAAGPYSDALKRRVGGDRGHLSNDQAARMVEWMVGPELHTLVLAHLSETNNTPELARAAAVSALARIGRTDVVIQIASQHAIGPNQAV